MARLPAILTLLRDTDSRLDASDWEIVARDLRRAGQLSEGKRGLGAAPVSLTDAANILIAGLASRSPSKGPEVVNLYRSMRLANRTTDQLPHDLEALSDTPNFGEALEYLLATCHLLDGEGWRLKLSFRSPVPMATLVLAQIGEGGTLVETGRFVWARGTFDFGPLTGDIQSTTEAILTDRTLIALARSL